MNTRHWLLWDGDCDFCRKAAKHLAHLDSGGRFTIIPYQEAPSPPMTPALRVQARIAVQVVTRDGVRFSGGRAVLFALCSVKFHPRLMQVLGHRPFIWAISAAYWFVARNRNLFNRFVPEP